MSIRARVRALRTRHRVEGELAEELQFHLEEATEANLARGMDPDAARRAALLELGGTLQVTQRVRDVRAMGVEALFRDVRVAIRGLLRSPRFSLASVLTVALMTGGITSVYAVLHGLVLQPLPYPQGDRLLFFETLQPKRFGTTLDLADVDALREIATFDAWGLCRLGYSGTVNDRHGDPLQVHDVVVSADVFSMFGIDVVKGRALGTADSAPDAPPVGVIGYDVWMDLFGGDPTIIGRSFVFELPKQQFTIVGVAEPGATVPTSWLSSMPAVWRPLRPAEHAEFPFTTFARVRSGASLDHAREEVKARAAALTAARPDSHAGRITSAVPLLDRLLGPAKQLVIVVFAAVSCVLLIGVANLVNLQLARNAARDREVLVRLALGAGRRRVMRQLLTETMLLVLTGSMLGLAGGTLLIQLFANQLPVPRAEEVGVNVQVAIVMSSLAVVLGLSAGWLPAWHATRTNLSIPLHAQGRGATRSRQRVQRPLLCVQTAAATMLLAGTGLLLMNLWRLNATEFGMAHVSDVWLVSGQVPRQMRDAKAQRALWSDVLAQVRTIHGVADVTLVSGAFVNGSDYQVGDVRPSDGDGTHIVSISHHRVAGNFFETLGMPVLRGRALMDSDSAGSEPVVVLNELAGRLLWPGKDPLGRRLQWGEASGPRRVVGVVPTHPHVRPHQRPGPQMFTPYTQSQGTIEAASLLVRTADGRHGPAQAAASTLSTLAPGTRLNVHSMPAQLWKLLEADRFRLGVMGAFSALAVTMALVGIVGLVAYTTVQRAREMAIRVALGASARNVIDLVTRQVLLPTAVGAILGLGAAVAAGRLLSPFLVRMEPVHWPTLLAAASILVGGATTGAFTTARAALQPDPAALLRED